MDGSVLESFPKATTVSRNRAKFREQFGGMTNHVAIGCRRMGHDVLFFAGHSHVGGLRASGGSCENGTGRPKGTKSANAAGPGSFGFLGFEPVCGPTKNMVLGYGNQR